MSLVTKTAPLGIDFEINELQRSLYASLLADAGWTNYESYPRAYVNEKSKSRIPETFIGNNEYKECLFDDKNKVTSFFLSEGKITFLNGGKASQDVSLIFQADIKKLYPAIAHRADAEIKADVYNAINKTRFRAFLKEIIIGVKDVYSDLSLPDETLDRIKMDDMSNYHIFKINFTITYNYKHC